MWQRWFLGSTVFLLLWSGAEVGAQSSAEELDRLVQASRLIFRGTVVEVGAATMHGVPVNERTAVVEVEEVFTPTGALGDHRKRRITVQLGKTPAAPGQSAVFFANGWIYGEGIAVVEVGRLEPGEDPTALRQKIAAAMKGLEDRKVLERIKRAEVVVVGKVREVRPVEDYQGPITEHAPDWHEAWIEIEAVEKGEAPATLRILFPASGDEFWIDSPKFEVGQEGVWLLQKDQQEKGWTTMRLPGYTALDPLDFWTTEKRGYIRDLLQGALPASPTSPRRES